MNTGVLTGIASAGVAPDVLAGDGGQNAALVAGSRYEFKFSTTVVQAFPAIDCSAYRWGVLQILTQGGSSFVNAQVSNDGSTWSTAPWHDVAPSTSGGWRSSASSSTGMFYVLAMGRYLRINVTGISSGTTSGILELFSSPPTDWLVASGTVATSPYYHVVVSPTTPTDGASNSSGNQVWDYPSIYNGATWDRPRVPTVNKTATATASGDTALWTPTSGKKFRLMRYMIQVTPDAATSGGAVIDIVLRDATTALAASFSAYVPAVSGTTFGNPASTGWVDLGHGSLSAAANNVLNINLSAALTAGKVRVVCAGTEE